MEKELACPVCKKTMTFRVARNGTKTYECRQAYPDEGPPHNTTVILPKKKHG